MKYVDFSDKIETEIDSSEVVEIIDSEIVDEELALICRTYDEYCIKIKFDKEETIKVGMSFYKQFANSLPEGMEERITRQLGA